MFRRLYDGLPKHEIGGWNILMADQREQVVAEHIAQYMSGFGGCTGVCPLRVDQDNDSISVVNV